MGCPIVYIWAAHTCTGSPYAYGLPVRVWAAHMCTGSPYAYRPKLLLRPYAYRYVGPYKYSYSYDVARGSAYQNSCQLNPYIMKDEIMRKIILINIHNLWKRNVYKTYFLP